LDLRNKIRSILRESFRDEHLDNDFTLYKALRLFVKGKITKRELEGSDKKIDEVKFRHGHPGEAEIIFELTTDSEFFELLDIDEDDGYFARSVTSTYGNGWEFNDYYTIDEDFKEGYIIYGDLDADNSEMLTKILFYLTGKKIDIYENNEKVAPYSKLLMTTFPREFESILSEYSMCRDEEMNKTASESIMSELNEFMQNIGFKIYQKFDLISTTPGNLLMWYSRLGDKTSNFEELFKMIVEHSNTRNLGGWADVQYEFRDENNFDSSQFNRTAYRELSNILEKIEDSTDFEEFKKMVEGVTTKFEVGKWYSLPKDSKIEFMVDSFNNENNTIKVMIRNNKSWKTRPIMMNLDNFNKFLYQPELFGMSDLMPESIKEYFDPLHFLKRKFSKKDDREIGGGLERVHQYGDEFQKLVDIIFKKAIKEKPVKHLKGLKVTSVWPQQLVDNDGIPNAIRWNLSMIPVVPDWFNYQKNSEFVNNTIEFEQIFRNYARYMGIEGNPPVSLKGNPNYSPDVLNNYISFNLIVKKFETF